MSVRGSQVAVAWFTMGSMDKPEVRLSISEDAGVSFQEPWVVDDADPIGRVDVTHLADGSLLVVWLGRAKDTGRLQARRFTVSGAASPTVEVAPMRASRRSGFPRVAAIADGALVAWTDPKAGVQLARISLR